MEEEGPQKFCCCGTKRAAQIALWIFIILYSISVIGSIFFLTSVSSGRWDDMLKSLMKDAQLTEGEIKSILIVIFIISLSLSVVLLLVTMQCLVYGVHKERAGYLRAWYIIHVIVQVLLVLGLISSLTRFDPVNLITQLINIALLIFALTAVRYHRTELLKNTVRYTALRQGQE